MNVETILKDAGVNPTAARIIIFRTLVEAAHPLSMLEIGDVLETVDKSVISRTLAVFRENHLVHVLEDGSDSTRYEICTSSDHSIHDDSHVHFHCEECGRTFCLDDVPVPEMPLPEGFEAHYANFMIKGICKECRSGKSHAAFE